MPHIIVKMFPGRTDDQKKELAEKISKEVVDVCGCSKDAVSLSYEEIPREEWKEKVYKPDIEDQPEKLWVKPGYKI